MRFVQRNPKTGEVVGHFANEQTYAKEQLPDDHPDIAAYKRRRAEFVNPSNAVRVAGTVRRSAYARGLTRVLAKHLGITEAELLKLITDESENG